MSETTIERAGVECVDELRPLWLGLRDHHRAVAPEMGPVRDDDATWERRSAQYRGWLAQPDAFALIVRTPGSIERRGKPIAYAMVRFADDPSVTWEVPQRVAVLETLAVSEGSRGVGTGKALVDRVQVEIEALGVTELRLDVIAGNRAARAFYARLGFGDWIIGMRRRTP